jgi:sugar O-acyltransferase (sialic acid O-acetyltransferase NeuD family)
MNKTKKLIVVGDSAFAEIAHEYFDADTEYQVVAFAVEAAFKQRQELNGLPVVEFETMDGVYPPSEHEVFVAVTYTQLNRLRSRLAKASQSKGYHLASYVSPRAFLWRNVKLGEHCFIFEDNTVQPFVTLGANVVLWSGNHIGHHSHIGDNCFISSHVVVSGFCDIGKNAFLGVNATIANNITLAKDNWIGPGVTITKNTAEAELYALPAAEPARVSSLRFLRIKE